MLRRAVWGGGIAILTALAGVAAACGSDPPAPGATSALDAGASALDAGAAPESVVDATAASAADAAADAGADAGPSVMVLVAGPGLSSDPVYGTSFTDGGWAPRKALSGSDSYAPGGLGVVVAGDGSGVAVLRSNGAALPYAARWNGGAWSGAAKVFSSATSFVGLPLATISGVAYARQSGSGVSAVAVDELALDSGTWSTGSALPLVGNNVTLPALAATAGGQLLLVDATAAGTYAWTLRTGNAWSAPVAIAGIKPVGAVDATPAIALAKRAGRDEIVGTFLAEVAGKNQLVSATFTGGAWSAGAVVAADVASPQSFGTPAVLAPLRDGRVALAYATPSYALKVAFYDGAWGSARLVPGVTVPPQAAPFGIARGAEPGAALELAYVDFPTRHVVHARLIDEQAFTWTTAVVDSSRLWEAVALSVGP